jgi:DNA polymerase epsilon subunit 1
LLWISSGPRPDLGGLEEDENYFADEHASLEVVRPGCYRDACIEIDVLTLPVNAVLHQELVETLDRTVMGGGGGDGGGGSAVDQSAAMENSDACTQAFKVLKNLLSNLFSDVMQRETVHADLLLRHFYRWLNRTASKLYDPALRRMVHKAMTNCFLQLVGRFRSLGATVVYANFQKIIISCGKPTRSRALAYSRYLMDTICDRPLFKYLNLDPTSVWANLLFMDNANYGGVKLTESIDMNQEELEEEAQQQAETDGEPVEIDDDVNFSNNRRRTAAEMDADLDRDYDDDDRDIDDDDVQVVGVKKAALSAAPEEAPLLDGELISNWNISAHLPNRAQLHFEQLIGEFLVKPYEHSQMSGKSVAAIAESGETVESVSKQLVAQTFSQSMFKMVEEIERIHSHGGDGDAGGMAWYAAMKDAAAAQGVGQAFTAGSSFSSSTTGNNQALLQKSAQQQQQQYTAPRSPALEFVKYVCAVLSLDSNVSDEVLLLRKSLMKLLKVKAFSAEAVFTNPSPTFVLPDVICEYCNGCKDMDLYRNPQLVKHEWVCDICQNPYNKEDIEYQLVQIAHRRSTAYQLQDLECASCRKVKTTTMAIHCKCAGIYKARETQQSFRQSLTVFLHIAQYHDMPLLLETVTTMLS